jgi:2,5-diketo-D-gluconate reductase A
MSPDRSGPVAPFNPTLPLNDGHAIPQLGLGVWQIPNDETTAIVRAALDVGYRSIDTATLYGNEAGVGRAAREGAVPRGELFVTTKLWHDRHDDARRAFGESLARLGLDSVDLYLIHWPAPRQRKYVDAWRTLVALREEGRARSVGVSNFNRDHLERIIDATGVVPAVNQVELHPRFQQRALRAFHAERGIVTEAWSPLGQGELLRDATITAIARKHGRTPAQVVIRWHLDAGHVAIPKSSKPARVRENFDVFGFTLDADDRERIAALDRRDGRMGLDPATFG